MRVRRVIGRERAQLQPWYQPYASPWTRKLDAGERAQLAHLHGTGQATVEQLAPRFGVSTRTVWRYLGEHPRKANVSAAGLRVLHEAKALGLRLAPAEAERLAIAALSERAA